MREIERENLELLEQKKAPNFLQNRGKNRGAKCEF
jgi:hypothetical protein